MEILMNTLDNSNPNDYSKAINNRARLLESINSNKLNIDRAVFGKTPAEKLALKKAKRVVTSLEDRSLRTIYGIGLRKGYTIKRTTSC